MGGRTCPRQDSGKTEAEAERHNRRHPSRDLIPRGVAVTVLNDQCPELLLGRGTSPATQLSTLSILPALKIPSGCEKPAPRKALPSCRSLGTFLLFCTPRATRERESGTPPLKERQAAKPPAPGVPGAQLLSAQAQRRLDRQLRQKKLKGLNSEKLGGI